MNKESVLIALSTHDHLTRSDIDVGSSCGTQLINKQSPAAAKLLRSLFDSNLVISSLFLDHKLCKVSFALSSEAGKVKISEKLSGKWT